MVSINQLAAIIIGISGKDGISAYITLMGRRAFAAATRTTHGFEKFLAGSPR